MQGRTLSRASKFDLWHKAMYHPRRNILRDTHPLAGYELVSLGLVVNLQSWVLCRSVDDIGGK